MKKIEEMNHIEKVDMLSTIVGENYRGWGNRRIEEVETEVKVDYENGKIKSKYLDPRVYDHGFSNLRFKDEDYHIRDDKAA
ncbi:MAG: hypothetical protein ACTSWQ_08650, partial [Candidatus Thorarchaeota archaeon]